MFGYILPNGGELTAQQADRYKSCYCGLCRALNNRYGVSGRMTLTYDMTFLVLLLSSLYEPEEESHSSRCAAHPGKKHLYIISEAEDYCADINVALAYYKSLDDWKDDRKPMRLMTSKFLESKWQTAAELRPRQCIAIKDCIEELSRLEAEKCENPDEPTNCFGRLMGELFVWKDGDFWEDTLRRCGSALGRFIYIMDAALDLKKDAAANRYNPLAAYDRQGKTMEDYRKLLVLLISECTGEFEKLPLCQDVDILRNILYSGLWARFPQNDKRSDG